MKTAFCIVLFLLFFFLIGVSPGAIKWHGDIEPENFKCIKVNSLKAKHPHYFLFFQKFHPFCIFGTEKKGAVVPAPILVVCFLGYFLFFFAFAMVVFLLLLLENFSICLKALAVFYCAEMSIVAIIMLVLTIISKRRENLKYK